MSKRDKPQMSGNKKITPITGDDKNRDKLFNEQQKKEEDDNMPNIVERPCTPAESLEQSLKEMKLIREGKIPKKRWKDFLKELKDDEEE